ncbi:Uncharacterised protein [Segatella copri]|nr:Uncharacterised protein [Segatella copri]
MNRTRKSLIWLSGLSSKWWMATPLFCIVGFHVVARDGG